MQGDHRVLELVQEILETNRTPEDVCAEHPELLWEVRKRWKKTLRVEARLEDLFPSSTAGPAGSRKTVSAHGGELPQIPGYEIVEVIGHGGMGVVFKARHLKLNRPIALKMLQSGAFARPHESARFIREAEAVAGLQQPNIVQVHDVGEFERCPYFTMELLDGGNLAQLLAGAPQSAMHSATSCHFGDRGGVRAPAWHRASRSQAGQYPVDC